MLRRTRAAARSVLRVGGYARHPLRAMSLRNCPTCDGHTVERAGTRAQKGSAMAFARVVEKRS